MNGAVEFDGGGGHAVVDDTFELTTDTITVIARINGWKTIDWSGIVVGRSDPASWWMGVAANNTLTYVWNNNSALTWNWQGAPEIPEDKWALVAIAIEPAKATSYIYHKDSGKLDAEVNDIPHIEQMVVNLKFGWDECCGARFFKGLIDEVMIYDRTLNADDLKRLATIGLPVESKANSRSLGGTQGRLRVTGNGFRKPSEIFSFRQQRDALLNPYSSQLRRDLPKPSCNVMERCAKPNY